MRLRPANADDLHRLDALERSAFSEPWSRAQLDSHLAHSLGVTLVAEDAPAEPALGYAALLLVAGEAELLRIATAPEARRRGVARELLNASLAQLRDRGVGVCYLEVREDNAPAIAFYASSGFALVGRRAGYYRDGTAAMLYRKELGGIG
jgi:ribosomal-protein-alanine N-acetyltransferase